jgi:RimJ/RimL family protein N-acetyltransferase
VQVLETERLILRHLTGDDAAFMLGLLNEPNWIRFIGDRNVRTLEQARDYILTGPIELQARLGFGFRLVELKASKCAIGLCGLAKRDYLDDVDIGFAFLPQFCGQGYAYEAAVAALDHAQTKLGLKRIVATTRPDNNLSIQLLEKLGLRFARMMQHDNRELKLFAIELGQAEQKACA